jgi:RNA polymerase sigma-70 factor (ECF subfamily)
VDEHQAIERIRNRDIQGLELIVRTHQVRAIRAAYLITRDVALAQDIVQAAFLRAYERIDQLDPTRPFAPWFFTSVLNDATRAVIRRGRHTSFELVPNAETDLTDSQPQPEAMWERAETADEIWTALGGLTAEQRSAVVARYYLGLNQAEMTRALGCTPSTVKWRLHAARARLRLLLAPLLSSD